MTTHATDATSLHLQGQSRDVRRARGVVYTPQDVAGLVLDQAFGASQGPSGVTLDPACGTGVFLLALVRRLAVALADEGVDIAGEARDAFLNQVKTLIWGMDTDAAAVAIARAAVRDLLLELSPGPLVADFMDANIITGDFLSHHPTSHLPSAPAAVVGNPPYVPTERIPAADRATYRSTFAGASGRLDLYTLFMEQAVRTVHPGGCWAFVTPDKFLSSRSAGAVRDILTRAGSLRSVALFSSHRVFHDAATVPCITVWQAITPGPSHVEVSTVTPADSGRALRMSAPRRVPSMTLHDRPWTFHHRGSETLTRRLLGQHDTTLRDVTSRISAGPATGYNPAFVLDGDTARTIEPELVHRTARGRDIQPFTILPRDEFMLVPYQWSASGEASLIDLADFPRARAWLTSHRARLEKRHCVRVWGKAWWDLHDPITFRPGGAAQVLVPDLARTNRFAVDDDATRLPQHSAYFLQPRGLDAHFLAAVLNTPAVEFLIRSQAPLMKDGFSRYRRQFLLDLPVPVADPSTTTAIVTAVKSGAHERAIALASELFDASAAELRAALDDLTTGVIRDTA